MSVSRWMFTKSGIIVGSLSERGFARLTRCPSLHLDLAANPRARNDLHPEPDHLARNARRVSLGCTTSTVERPVVSGVLFGPFLTAQTYGVCLRRLFSSGTRIQDLPLHNVASADDRFGTLTAACRALGEHIEPLESISMDVCYLSTGICSYSLFNMAIPP